jgi:hypothetical protein
MEVDFTRPSVLFWGLCNLFFKDKERSNRGHSLLASRSTKAMRKTLSTFTKASLDSMSIRPGTLYMYSDQESYCKGSQKARHVNQLAREECAVTQAEAAEAEPLYRMCPLDTNDLVLQHPWLQHWKSVLAPAKSSVDSYLLRRPSNTFVHPLESLYGSCSSIVSRRSASLLSAGGGSSSASSGDLVSRIPGGVYVASDWTADARKFVVGLKETTASRAREGDSSSGVRIFSSFCPILFILLNDL